MTLALILTASPTLAQTPADSAGIRDAALDYIEGWYTGDAERMERALHPRLVKRIAARRGGRETLIEMSGLELVQATRRGGGSDTPRSERRTEVTILDIFEGAAAVRVDAGRWIDYLQLAKVGGDWVIVNVLWELRPEPGG
ncbi:MAG: nuclear transport factor 2 family protein [Gemmatimonadetes bacterium]|nr:nuclear transport factor 2 family protein [Gemmatimonadota bacterium]NIX23775.1 nuclear transport factor 2 family protein [Actinomycetota bacterium]